MGHHYSVSLYPCQPCSRSDHRISRFIVECTHYISRAATFGRARLENQPEDELSKRTIPLTFVTVFVFFVVNSEHTAHHIPHSALLQLSP